MTPLDQLGGKYATVVIDPPWPIGGFTMRGEKGRNSQGGKYNPKLSYPSLSIDEIRSLPISSVVDSPGVLLMWSVNRFLPISFSILEGWGVKYSFTMAWVKSAGTQMPNTPCFNTEWILVGMKGNPKFLETKRFPTGNFWERKAHSEKPEGFYDLLRRVTPAPRLDIFGRRRIAGFDSWGDEAPDLPPLPDHYQTPMF